MKSTTLTPSSSHEPAEALEPDTSKKVIVYAAIVRN
jgi:hypothetical protein